MKQVLVAVLVLAVWVGLTAVAAWAVPERGGDKPDLAFDSHWLLRTPPNPVQYDKVPRGTSATTTTTTTRFTTPGPTPRAAAPRPPPTKPNTAGVEQWRGLVASYPGWDVDLMLRVMWCESKGVPTAINSIGAAGLFQHYPTPPNWQDPAANVALAYSKWRTRGLQPWTASRSCWS